MYKCSVIIPCHNEAYVLFKKIENTFALGESVQQIIIINDYSDDFTQKIGEDLARKNKKILVLNNSGDAGKNFAVSLALKYVSEEVVLMTDADIMLPEYALDKIFPLFDDMNVGGISLTPKLITDRKNEKYVAFYEKFVKYMKIVESKIDSVTVPHGQALFFRRSANVQGNIQADDVDIAIQLRKKGFRMLYLHTVPFIENISADLKKLYAQKIRRSKAVINSLLYHYDVFFNIKYGFFGLFCYPFNLLVYVFSPFIFLFCIFIIWLFFLFVINMMISTIIIIILLGIFYIWTKGTIFRLMKINFKALFSYMCEEMDEKWKPMREINQ